MKHIHYYIAYADPAPYDDPDIIYAVEEERLFREYPFLEFITIDSPTPLPGLEPGQRIRMEVLEDCFCECVVHSVRPMVTISEPDLTGEITYFIDLYLTTKGKQTVIKEILKWRKRRNEQ